MEGIAVAIWGNERIMEHFLLKAGNRPEVVAVASDEGDPSQHDRSTAFGLAVATRILGQILWPELDEVALADRIGDIGHRLQVRGLTL